MKDIKNLEGRYAITSCGKVWSYKRKKYLKPMKDKDGYLYVNIRIDGKQKNFKIHRLVAEAYIPNPDGKPQVNHKNEVKTDNYINNLEWATAKENINYGTHNERISDRRKKPVFCLELNRVFDSAKTAGNELNICSANITKCCMGNRKTCGGYHWQYVEVE